MSLPTETPGILRRTLITVLDVLNCCGVATETEPG